MLKLWLLRPVDVNDIVGDNPWEPWFDKAFGFVVCAESEEEARKLANASGGEETGPVTHNVYRTGGDPWLDSKFSICIPLVAGDKPEVILEDFASA